MIAVESTRRANWGKPLHFLDNFTSQLNPLISIVNLLLAYQITLIFNNLGHDCWLNLVQLCPRILIIVLTTHLSNFFILVKLLFRNIQVRIKSDTLNQIVLVFEILNMSKICRRPLIIKSILLMDHFHGCTIIVIICKHEQFKQVTVIEILLERFFVRNLILLAIFQFMIAVLRWVDLVILLFAGTFNGCEVHRFLVNLSSVDHFFDSADGHESVDYHISFLANSVATIDGLIIICRVPIRIHNDRSIGTCKIQTKASNFCRQKTTKEWLIIIELLTNLFSWRNLSVTINSKILEVLRIGLVILYNEFH